MPRHRVHDRELLTIQFRPIEDAPTHPGVEFGWCVVATDDARDFPSGFGFARYNGEDWFGDDGLRVDPVIWALLPKRNGEIT